jgi:hypothetical protein
MRHAVYRPMPDAVGTSAPRAFGENLAWREGSELICLRLVGRLEASHFRDILECCLAWNSEMGRCAVLVDLTEFTTISSSARAIAMELRRGGVSASCACFGASFKVQIFADMLMRARRLLGGNSRPTIARYFRTEEEARSYITTQLAAAAAP